MKIRFPADVEVVLPFFAKGRAMSFPELLKESNFYLGVLGILGCLGLLYLFVTTLVHVIKQKDMSRGSKVAWVIALFVVPPVTMIVYLAYQMQTFAIAHQYDWDKSNAARDKANAANQQPPGISAADEIKKLNELKQSGLITSEEFSLLRAKLLT